MENSYVSNPWDDIPKPDGERLTYIKRGVVWVEKKPYYIVDLIKEPEHIYVMVYGVHPNTEKDPKKLAKEVKIKNDTFSNATRLGTIANALVPKKTTFKWVVEPPLFVAPIIPEHTATLTGRIESGFFEREPDQRTTVAGERKINRGRNTGVFIGMSSVVWEEGFKVPTESIIKSLQDYQQGGFYDLEGNNQDKDNPLSQFYGNSRGGQV